MRGLRSLILTVAHYLYLSCVSFCQSEVSPEGFCTWQRRMIEVFAGNSLHGRGYVADGMSLAARTVADSFAAWGLKPPPFANTFLQPFRVSVNTFPDTVSLFWGRRKLAPGLDFHVQPECPGIRGTFRVRPLQPGNTLGKLRPGRDVVFLDYAVVGQDSLKRHLEKLENHYVAAGIPVIRISAKHLPWYPASSPSNNCVFTIYPRARDKTTPIPRWVTLQVNAKFEPSLVCYNAMGYKPGRIADTFLVVTAHLDHLGRMGSEALYAGANDNASGTAMMMALAKAFATLDTPRYSVLFVGFGAEELGLVGSQEFVKTYPSTLSSIRFLLNLDLMGGGDKGVTFVNGKAFPALAHLADSLNMQLASLASIQHRDNAPNSDHYPFTIHGVPAVFLFAQGEGIAYHDVLDTAERLPMHNCPRLFEFIWRLLEALQKPLPASFLGQK